MKALLEARGFLVQKLVDEIDRHDIEVMPASGH